MKYRNILKKRILAGLLAGAAACAAAPAVLAAGSPVANDTLPQLADPDKPFFAGQGHVDLSKDNQMTIHQNSQNAVIKWDSFNVGANATVNFEKGENYNGGDRFNTLNYVNQANGMSQIYGAISAAEGNIYIVNPAGVEISNSAQINVGSLYVSNKKMTDENLSDFQNKAGLDAIYNIQGETQDAVLMSLGNINADKVTFDGDRIVIDTERLKTGDGKMTGGNIIVHTTDKNNVVIGYDAYEETFNGTVDANTYEGKDKKASDLATVYDADGNQVAELKAYMWVEDVEQLQAIDTNLGGNYALRNSIDATATQDWADNSGTGKGFVSIGSDGEGNSFTGKFDGLDYNIFNLNIDRDTGNVGLFGVVGDNAVIRNVTLVGGSITGQNNVGALAGSVQGGAQISNITNSASVTGKYNVGGIVGESKGAAFTGLVNTGTIEAENSTDASNAGGLIGSMNGGTLGGASYNLGSVTGEGHNVGGLVGHAYASKLGDGTNLIYNRLNVSGAYNVGGIVGSMKNTTVKNAENSGNVTATGHTTETYKYHSAKLTSQDSIRQETVNIANAGGIAGMASGGSKISDVQNSGDVSSGMDTKDNGGYTFYTAGNVGGIVGRAEDTNITDATNTENDVRGAHNVGGIAGYFGSTDTENTDVTYTITRGVNNGGDILATGAVDKGTKGSTTSNELNRKDGFITEYVRGGSQGSEQSIIGNIGGIAGYMYGDNVYIASSANRGTVHSQDISTEKVLPVNQAANAGGIVGKIDRSHTIGKDDATGIIDTEKIKDELGTNYEKAAVSNSYNTGDVRGYMGVGGVAGMMYNGEIAGSYNLGTVNTTRNQDSFKQGNYFAVNMGGIVGDTTEETDARAVLYDVYNKGQIGDETFNYYARHVGGVVGRLSGAVEKAYNTGAIYNGYSIVGGIVGWLNAGSVTNSFNTGNITVWNHDGTEASNVGGIAGDVNIATGDIVLTNVYNLGTLRSIKFTGGSLLGGIVGAIHSYHDSKTGKLLISNAYTTGNLYSDGTLGSILGEYRDYQTRYHLTNTYYIKPDPALIDATQQTYFKTLEKDTSQDQRDNSNAAIDFKRKDQAGSYTYEDSEGNPHSLTFTTQGKGSGKVDEGNETTIKAADTNWRIYDGSTPILNAFLPNTEKYFSGETGVTNAMDGIASIQYGTAYDPLLTIIHANTDTLKFDWQALGANNAAGIAVYGAGLTLDNFMATGGSGYFGGMIYSDGALTVNAHTSEGNTEVTGDVALGSASQLYGSSVTISADGNVTIYGDVIATGNGISAENKPDKDNSGSIFITGGSVDVYGQLTSAKKGNTTFVPGINNMADVWTPGDVEDQTKPMTDIGDRFGYTTGASTATGSISITANETASEDGHVNVYYGHQQKGFLDTAGDLTVKASGDVYMDSDLSIGGDLSLKAGDNSEVVLDISNIGKVQAEKGTITDALVGLHNFLNHFAQRGENVPSITLDGGETKLAVDMWGDGAFDLTKYDLPGEVGAKLADKLDQLHINGETGKGKHYTYIWVSTGEQLAGIQQYKNSHSDSNILTYNFALKNDIDASDVTNYEAIGTGAENGYTGTFDGRDNRIIGLDTTKRTDGKTLTNAGIFDTIGIGKNADSTEQVGTVEDLRVYSGTFTGKDNAGAVAGVNKGNISNVTAFGNVVTAQGSTDSTELGNLTEGGSVHVGAAGGIAGVNYGIIDNASAVGTATAADAEAGSGALSTAGGIAGINMYDENINKDGGIISNSTSNSAVNASKGNAAALGGVAGVNAGELNNVDSLGVTTGIYQVGEHNPDVGTQYSNNVGGIAGTNSGTVTNVYNESIVSGRDNVGGILGVNTGASVTDVSNAARVTGEAASDDTSDYVGGLVGSNSGSITNGRNNGEITGSQYVGGLVGNNASGSNLSNLVNDEAASITGDNYVGGIAGSNAGTITADEKNDNLVNRGSITGQMYVGGVAGSNEESGIITNTISSIALHVKTPYTPGQNESTAPKYFGGVVGQNSGTINGATNKSSVDVAADGATMVGGIIGENTKSGKLAGDIANEGLVSGKSNVGGIIGSNENDGILNNTSNNRLVVSNSGRVQAEDGGAAGIFYNNTGVINNADLINTGMVIGGKDAASVTGGLFGMNSGKITNSTLTNTGTVYGGGTVGGLIGKNEGDISTSSLINSVDGKVIGLNNVGGLIGQNYGTITGGRDENDGYYKYQIYNNGTIAVGMWNDNDNKIIDAGEITTGNVKGSNIGGLVGLNGYDEETKKTGSITAGYNTGAIDAAYSENVGGIAGTNTGKLDQVFNTVITGVGTDGSNVYGSITGGTNVGGIVGTNTGTISNAYNTTAVTGTTDFGYIAGTNSNTDVNSISNIYSSIGDKLVGSGTVSNVYNEDANSFGKYGASIDFKGGEEAIWRQYGDNNPILKVFLTTVTYNPDENDQHLVYNGQDQTLNITGNGFWAADQFVAHNSVTGGLIYHDVTGEHKNAGNYTDDLWSEQIKAGGEGDTFNPNHLGYDVQSVGYTIDQKELTIDLGDVTHEYGSPNLGKYEGNFTVSGWVEEEDFSGNISLSDIKDEGLKDNTHTKDVGSYTWSANATINGTFGQGDAGNYKITAKPNAGKSTVTQKTITVNLDDVVHTYGDNQDESKYGIRDTIKWANDDTYTNGDVVLSGISDEAFDGTTGHTNNAGGDYRWTADVSGTGSDAGRINQNYKFEVGKGYSEIEKKGITIELGDVSHVYGTPNKDGYTFTANGWVYDEDFSKDVNIGSLGDGITDNALKDNNHHTQDVNQDGYTWTTDKAGISGDGATNYYVKSIVDGKSAVTPVTIDVELGDISHEYGTPNDDYGLKNDIVWANGDTYTNEDIILGNIQDEALKDGTPTKGVGDYIWEASVSGTGSDAERIKGNYVFNVKQGASKVTPKDLHIIVDDKDIYVGEPVPEYTGHMDDLVNGDTMTDAPVYSTDPAEEVNTAQTGSYDIGVQFGNNYISSGDGYDWTKVWDGFKNYNVIFEPGKLTISDMPVDRPSEGEHWNFLFDDNPWDRNRDFRERKAEVHFVAGGMTL